MSILSYKVYPCWYTIHSNLYELSRQDPNDKSKAKVSLEKDGEPRVELLKLLTFTCEMKLHQWLEKKLPSNPRNGIHCQSDVPVEKGEISWVKFTISTLFTLLTNHTSRSLCQNAREVQDDMTVGRRVLSLTMGWCLNCHESHPQSHLTTVKTQKPLNAEGESSEVIDLRCKNN